jgi:hypothetical protein
MRRIPNKKAGARLIRDTTKFALTNAKSGSSKRWRYFIELGHTYPAWSKLFPLTKAKEKFSKHSHSAQNPYGHTNAGLYMYDGDDLVYDRVYNVGLAGPKGINRSDFMHDFPFEDYYFNNYEENKDVTGNQQGGILERSFLTLNLEVDGETWYTIHNYYEDVKRRSATGQAEFRLASHLFRNNLAKMFPTIFGSGKDRETGNCCYWTSKAFMKAGLLNSHNNYPLTCFFTLLLNILYNRAPYFENTDADFAIVFYEGAKHQEQPKGTFLYPGFWLKHGVKPFWNTEKMADIKVSLGGNDKDDQIQVFHDATGKPRERLLLATDYLKKIFV